MKFAVSIALIVLSLSLICYMGHSQTARSENPRKLAGKSKGSRKGKISLQEGDVSRFKPGNIQRQALEAWVASFVPEVDYNASHWRYHLRSVSTTDYFYSYTGKLAKTFKKLNAELNLVMVGACDGKSDPLIKNVFLRNPNWRAVFVEPVEMNVRDLTNFLSAGESLNRSYIIRAAATSKCTEPTIRLERPMYEERAIRENKTVAHWLRRQIGSILPEDRKGPRPDWTIEVVECKTAQDILREWSKAVPTIRPSGKIGKSIKRRPHILKIDVEGHDFEVLTGFVNELTPVSELPLLICFEAKSIAEKFPLLKSLLETKGYVVSHFGQDGFAMLKGDHVLTVRNEGKMKEDFGKE